MPLEAKQIIEDLEKSAKYFSKLHDEMEKDFNYRYGRQWKDDDVKALDDVGVKAITINKIRPMMNLVTGIERQSKSDFKAFPEGEEDSVKAEVTTRLFKNIAKTANLQRKTSEQFETGVAGGEGVLEAYIDRTFDLITGELKYRHVDPLNFFPDPAFKEYDLSDAQYLCIVRPSLTKEQLIALFPEKKSVIEGMADSQITIPDGTSHFQNRDYEHSKQGSTNNDEDIEESVFDLIDYYYKVMIKRFFVADQVLGTLFETDNKEAASQYVEENQGAVLIEKEIPEIRIAHLVGDEVLEDDISEFFPTWKEFPVFPYFAELATVEIDSDLKIQGIVRSMRDLNEEYNKRRTQELRHLNSTANSGWWVPSDGKKSSLTRRAKTALKKVGASPGFVGDYDATIGLPTKITPTPLSQGHAQLAAENAQDIKEVSGVNPDLLANDSQSQSGRAILLKQRQGLVMLQGMLDNYADTKKRIGRFIVSQLNNLYTPETALRVLGEAYIDKQQAFKTTPHEVVERAVQKSQQGEQLTPFESQVLQLYPDATSENPAQSGDGQLVTVTDPDVVNQFISGLLQDTQMTKFDVSIGEGPFAETIRMSDFATMTEMAEKGIPVPPQLLVGHSMLPESAKEQIIAAIQAAQQQPQPQ